MDDGNRTEKNGGPNVIVRSYCRTGLTELGLFFKSDYSYEG